MFDALATITCIHASELGDEVEHYLTMPLNTPSDALAWWIERCSIYPNLSCMVLDYLTIPGELFLHFI